MSTTANQTHLSLAIDGSASDLQMLSFGGREAISQLFTFSLELVGKCPVPGLESLLHKPAFLTLGLVGNGIHGLVHSTGQGDSGKRLTRCCITPIPQLVYLIQCTNQRISQHLTVPQIVILTLEGHDILANAYRFQLGTRYPEREYCVQYGESDLQFVQRLYCKEGIYFHLQHDTTAYLLVSGDDQMAFPRLVPVVHQQDSGLVTNRPTAERFSVCLETRTSRVIRRDRSSEKLRLTLESTVHGKARLNLEDYDYPGRFVDRERGKRLIRRILERQRNDYRLAEGRSDQSLLLSGHLLPLATHPQMGWNGLWLLTEVVHEGWQPQVLEESIVSDISTSPDNFQQGYCNCSQATSQEAFFCSPPTPPKPRVLDTQSAAVTGPKGKEVRYDRYGRVRAQFRQDRGSQADDSNSCWLRVASGWAGRNHGAITIPRVGVGVLVTFLESGLDQPLVTDCLFHRERLMSYEPPAHKTRSVFKSFSSPGGGGYGELCIEGHKDQEQIFVHAQRDWGENIEHDQKIHIDHQRRGTVRANSYSEFRTEEHRATHAERKVETRASDHLTVVSDQHLKIVSGQLTEAGQKTHLDSGLEVVLEAGAELTPKGGGSSLKLNAGGVTLSGTNVRVNSGGSPGSDNGTVPLLPRPSLDADAATVGQVLDNPARSHSERKGPEQLIVDVWGDPA